jgi:tripartite-type tricarboxylate transporter receptor subunit TctC
MHRRFTVYSWSATLKVEVTSGHLKSGGPAFEMTTSLPPTFAPSEVIERLNRAVNEGLAQPDIRARLADVGTVPMVLSPGEFRAYIATEFEKWDKVVKSAGIKLG